MVSAPRPTERLGWLAFVRATRDKPRMGTAHELSEARTDPVTPGAWYDGSGQENGDKCAWTFNVPSVTLSDGTRWELQGEWSNAAYNTGTGYPNSAGQAGCLDGY